MRWCRQYVVGVCVVGLLALSVNVRPAGAQNLGILGGLNFASAEAIQLNDAETTLDNRTGYHFGAYLDIGSDMLWIRPGVEYISAGPLYQGIEDDIPVELRDDFDVRVFAVPVDVRLEFGPSFARPYAFAGPVVHFRWLADAPEPFENSVEPRDFAGTVGGGFRIGGDRADLRFVPQVRYTFGLANVLDETFTVDGVTIVPADEDMSFILVSLALEF